MIKKINFFIRINGKPCRTLEDLQSNFYVQDVVALHKGGVLRRWLSCNNEEGLAEQIQKLPENEDEAILARELTDMLCPHADESHLEAALHYYSFEKQRKELHTAIQDETKFVRDRMKIYHAGYFKTLQAIAERNHDFSFLCRAATELVDEYWLLIETNRTFFLKFVIKKAPCVLFPLLAMGQFRTNSEEDNNVRKELEAHINGTRILLHSDANEWYKALCNSAEDIQADPHFTVVTKPADHWDDIVQSTKHKVMVFYANNTANASVYVRSKGTREEIDHATVNALFPVFEGLEYRSSPESIVTFITFPDFMSDRCIKFIESISCDNEVHSDSNKESCSDSDNEAYIDSSIADLINALKAIQKFK
jgi:hypothetical protein